MKFDKSDENLKKVGVMHQIGSSMPLEPGGKIPYIKHESGKKYEIGQIIVYKLENGLNVYHQVVGYTDTDSGRVYETQGINNKYPDSKEVYDHQIIGQVVKFSKQDLAYLIELAERGRIDFIEGLGMTKQSELVVDIAKIFFDNTKNPYFDIQYSFTRFSEFVTSKSIGSIDSNYFSDLMNKDLSKNEKANKVIDLMYRIQNLDYSGVSDFKGFRELSVKDGLRTLKAIKAESLKKCIEYLKSEILTDYTATLFSKYVVSRSPFSMKAMELSFVMDILNHIDRFNREEITLEDMFVVKTKQIINFNEFILGTWGKSYTQLLIDQCKIEQSTDQEYINELKQNGELFTEENIIWITKDPKTGEILWLELGKNDYSDSNKGAGLEHIFQDHTINEFGSDNWGNLITPRQQAALILDSVSNDANYKMVGSYRVYELNINGNLKYLAVLQSNFNGFIVTARPFSTDEGKTLFGRK
ncbi:MAG: hypothetical protein ACFFDF_09225 [Candidatus Odinarchaeota archaeon]